MYAPFMAARRFSAPVVLNYFISSSLQNLPRTTRMCRVPIFLSKETIKEKRWPSYRGRRAGQQVNNREIVRRRCISTIERPRRVYCWSSQSHGTQRNISNCKYISPNTPGSKLAFVPSFLLSCFWLRKWTNYE